LADLYMQTALTAKINSLIAATVVILVVPILKILVEYQTFIHPWRPELAASTLLIVFLIAVYRDAGFKAFLAELRGSELHLIVFPLTAFIAWSALSVLWAVSTSTALYHTAVWTLYLAFYALFRRYASNYAPLTKWMGAFMVFLWVIGLPPLIEYYAYVVSGNASTIGLRYSKYTEIANTIAPLVAAYAMQSKGRSSYFGYATVVLVLLFDIASLSRTGVGIFVIESTVLVLLTFIIPSLKIYKAKAAILAAALFTTAVLSSAALIVTVGSVPVAARAVDSSTSDSSNTRPFFLHIALEMWRENPIIGVGADNYGLEFSNYRQKYAVHAPDDPGLRLADDQLAERAHNEYAQILAELGVVGIGIFAMFLFGIACSAFYIWKVRAEISLNTVAALVGASAFLASSLVTSYSFRIFQNGLVFFFVLAVAVGGTLGRYTNLEKPSPDSQRSWIAPFAIIAALVSSVFLAGYCLIRVAAVHEMLMGANTNDPVERDAYYSNALALDPENALIYRAVWSTALSNGDTRKAAEYLRKSIDRGQATTTDYSYLATAQILNGDLRAADAAIDEALKQYPMSTFLRVRKGVILQMMGKTPEADQQFARANELDARQAATWRVYLESGAARASQFAFDSNGVEVMDLLPKNAVYAIKKERDIRFPEEKTEIPF
jgi:O-antigen ligase